MDYNLEIQRLLLKRDNAPLPIDRIAVLKQAINLADIHNDLQWGYDLRIDLIDEESNTTRSIDSFPAFAWIIDAYDSDPDLFNVDYLLGKYRWMIGESYRNLSISIAQLQQMLIDFKLRLKSNGYSLRTYYTAKADLGFFLNNDDMISENIELRDDEEVNQTFDYWLSELYADIEFALRKNKFEQARQLERKITVDSLEYAHYPLAIYASFTRYLTRIGDSKKAGEYLYKAEECLSKIENDQSTITSIGKLMQYLLMYDKKRAWQYFEQYVNWTIDCDDCTAVFFALDVLPLLRYEKEVKILQVNSQLPWYRLDNTYNPADLYKYYYELALNLSKRFDERNGNNVFMGRFKQSQNIQSKWGLMSVLKKIFRK